MEKFSGHIFALGSVGAVYSVSGWVALPLTAGVMGEGVGGFNVNS